MKIAFTTNSLDVGGIEMNIVRLCRALTERGHEVSALTRGGSLVPQFEQTGGVHRTIDMSVPRIVRASRQMRHELGRLNVDLVHSFSALGSLTLRAAFPTGAPFPVVASIMGLRNDDNEPTSIVRARAFVTTLGVNPILVIAPSIERLLVTLPIRSRRVRRADVVGVPAPPPSAVDAAATSEFREALGLTPTQCVVATVGRLTASKRHDLFIRAAAILARTDPDVMFLLVGAGELEDGLRALAVAEGLAQRLLFLGARHDVDTILAAANVCVRPGTVEGFVGITVIEAQLVGTPVVAFATEDVRLSIDDGRSGLLVHTHTPAALARTVSTLLGSEALSADLVRGGYASARRFELDAVAERLETVYESVLSTGRTV